MTESADQTRPWSERSRGQRVATYGVVMVLSAVFTYLWWTGAAEGSTGLAALGDVLFPLGVLFFAVRIVLELRFSPPEDHPHRR
jgi:hypothetical protein